MATSPLSPTDFSSAVSAITAAFGDPTRREIYLFAHDNAEGVTASEVAEQFDLHPNVARHHLDKLTSAGHLTVHVDRPAGTNNAGRPSKRYRPHGDAVGLDLPVRHDDLLVSLLGRALSMLPEDLAEAMAEEVGADHGRSIALGMGENADVHRSVRTALQAVAEALSAHGFAARTEQVGDELRIVSEHCPFGDAAMANPVICAVDRGLVRGMLETIYGSATASTCSSRARGQALCVTRVEA